MLHVGWALITVSLLPLLAKGFPVFDSLELTHVRRQDAPTVVTETVTSTYLDTSTATTFTTITSAGADSSSVSPPVATLSPSTDSDVQPAPTVTASPVGDPVLFLPPNDVSQFSSTTPSTTSTSTDAPAAGTPSATASPAVMPAPTSTSQATPSTPAVKVVPQVMAYYPDWSADAFPPEKVDFSRFDWIDFAFAVPTADFSIGWDGSDDAPDLLRRLVSSAHNSGKHVKLSVGGWSGSKYFSSAVSTAQNRQIFANNLLAAYNELNLDGIDIDWEYPGQAGNDGNIVSPSDTDNFLAFLQLLRQTLPPTAKITAAAMTVPWADSQGNPMKDMSAFGQVLDWILVMNYDTWGSSKTPGPNAPLSDACHNSTQTEASALSAIETWTTAGFPASKIVLGVPSYGYISRSSEGALHGRSLHAQRRSEAHSHHTPRRHGHGFGVVGAIPLPMPLPLPVLVPDSPSHAISDTDTPPSIPETAPLDSIASDADAILQSAASGGLVKNEDGGTDDGQVQFRDLIKQGVLQYIPAVPAFGPNTTSSDPKTSAELTRIAYAGHQITNLFTALSGFTRKWDSCSSTPYLTSAGAKQVVTYDDPQSLEMKAVFVREAGLLGVNMFDVHGDTDQWDLTDAIRRGLGL